MSGVVGAVRGAVELFARRHDLLPAGSAVVVAVSGGPDSVCLLDCLHALAPALGLRLHVAHLDHGLRADGSAEQDAAYVRYLGAHYGLPVTCERQDTRQLMAQRRLGAQEAARLVRYRFLEGVADRLAAEGAAGAVVIATGHTADDQAETLLLHLLRGSGLSGLAGMRPRRGQIVHPLLETPRAAVEAYCAALGLSPRQDPSNLTDAYMRNRLRHELLPLLERYNPRVRQALAGAATALAGDLAYLDSQADRLLPSLIRGQGGLSATEPAWLEVGHHAWAATPPTLRPHLVRALLTRLYGSTEGFGQEHLLRLVQLLAEAPNKKRYAQFPHGLTLEQGSHGPRLWAGPPPAAALSGFSAQALPIPGTLALPTGQLTTTLEAAGPDLLASLSRPGQVEGVAHADADAVGQQVVARPRRAGDTLQPLGMAGRHRKLQDLLVDAHVPRAMRDSLPLITRPTVHGQAGLDQIVWVAGLRLAEPFKVTAATTRVLRLAWQPTTSTRQKDAADGSAGDLLQ